MVISLVNLLEDPINKIPIVPNNKAYSLTPIKTLVYFETRAYTWNEHLTPVRTAVRTVISLQSRRDLIRSKVPFVPRAGQAPDGRDVWLRACPHPSIGEEACPAGAPSSAKDPLITAWPSQTWGLVMTDDIQASQMLGCQVHPLFQPLELFCIIWSLWPPQRYRSNLLLTPSNYCRHWAAEQKSAVIIP